MTKIVEGEIVPPDGESPRDKDPIPKVGFFHPWSGAVILGIDWMAFGMDLFSGFVLLALVSAGSFLLTFWAVWRIQTELRGDSHRMATLKALIGGLAAGVPFPIGGTIVGATILALSGLPKLGK